MKKTDFKKLKVDQRVLVTGTQSGKTFSNAPGVVVGVDNDGDRTVRFDNWREGHGHQDRQWAFYADDYRNFDIRPEPVKAVEPKPRKRPHGAQEYKGNGKHHWETVTGDTKRLRVPGGWLYGEYSHRLSRVVNHEFVPVPQVVGYAV